eukprot:384499_1
MPFISQNSSSWYSDQPINFDGNGYVKSLLPEQFVGSLLLDIEYDENGWHYLSQGEHIFLYDGDCSGCDFQFNAKIIDKSQNGRWIINITQSNSGNYGSLQSVYFTISSIEPNNYPKNFVLVPSQYENNYKSEPWDPDWLKPLIDNKFMSYRFMDFLYTVNSPNQYWSHRIMPNNYTQADIYGIAWEWIIDLANRFPDVAPWINIPRLATNNYISSVAQLWYNTYKGNAKIYIEYSNECWNTDYECHNYCVQQAAAQNISNWQWYGQHVCKIRSIWDEIYGKNSDDKLFMVMASFYVNSWLTQQELYNHSQCVNGVAIAPYYCVYNMSDEQIVAATVDELFDNIESEITQQHYANFVSAQVNVTKVFNGHDGKPLVVNGYEGGFGCVPDYSPYRANLTVKYNQMVINPRVSKGVYLNLEMMDKITGGQIYNIFNYIGFGGEYGDFGHLQFQDSYYHENQNGRYKFDGIVQYLNKTQN